MMLSEPFWILIFDAALGVMQWLLLLRFAYGIFLPENTKIFGIIHNNKVTDPVIKSVGFSAALCCFLFSDCALLYSANHNRL